MSTLSADHCSNCSAMAFDRWILPTELTWTQARSFDTSPSKMKTEGELAFNLGTKRQMLRASLRSGWKQLRPFESTANMYRGSSRKWQQRLSTPQTSKQHERIPAQPPKRPGSNRRDEVSAISSIQTILLTDCTYVI